MANIYTPEQLGITAPSGGFRQGGWYNGRQYWGGTLSDPNTIHPSSNQIGAGAAVSAETNAQSAKVQNVTVPNFNQYLQDQWKRNPQTPSGNITSSTGGGMGAGGASSIGGAINTQSQTTGIDLPSIYKSLYDSSGVSKLEQDLITKTQQYNDAVSKINDNPFLSEATRVGRVQKLTQDFNASISNVKNDIATRKADIETNLNLQAKQYDINSAAATTALNQFNSLLKSGALDNASADDIANITRSTGLSSNMIQSAINANKQSNIKTETIKYDDGTNQGYAIINSQTGEIISRQAVSASEPKKTTTSGGITTTQDRNITATARKSLKDVDTNGDQSVSAQEYIQAVQDLMTQSGIDEATADNYLTKAMTDLKFTTWKWKK